MPHEPRTTWKGQEGSSLETSEWAPPGNTLISNLGTPRLGETISQLFKAPGLWSFIPAAPGNETERFITPISCGLSLRCQQIYIQTLTRGERSPGSLFLSGGQGPKFTK